MVIIAILLRLIGNNPSIYCDEILGMGFELFIFDRQKYRKKINCNLYNSLTFFNSWITNIFQAMFFTYTNSVHADARSFSIIRAK